MPERIVIFVQGAGEGAHREDAKLANDLGRRLGAGYRVRFPAMPNEADADYATWAKTILEEIAAAGDGAILAGHSVGGSVAIKLMTGRPPKQSVAGLFLISAPFWHDDDFWHWKEARLPPDAAARLPDGMPLFLYHGRDDKTVPFGQLEMYAKVFPQATVHRLPGRDHQLNGDLSEVARDIRNSGLSESYTSALSHGG